MPRIVFSHPNMIIFTTDVKNCPIALSPTVTVIIIRTNEIIYKMIRELSMYFPINVHKRLENRNAIQTPRIIEIKSVICAINPFVIPLIKKGIKHRIIIISMVFIAFCKE